MTDSVDQALEGRARKTTERISENMHIIANEPSLALYRLQEHVRKAIHPMIDRRAGIHSLHHDLQGHCYDIEYAVSALSSMENVEKSFNTIRDNLKNAIFLKQQLKYEETRRKKADSSSNSVYKRFSAHITLDLPEMSDLSDVVRETANRVENIVSNKASNSSSN